MNNDEDLERLETTLGHRFARRELLRQALTHSSRTQDQLPSEPATEVLHNEKLEFLGDAILGFVASEALLERFPTLTEGQLSRIKANLVSARRLYRVAQGLDLGAFLRLGRGEEKTGGRVKPGLLADAVEALIAALYLDGDLAAARQFIRRFILADLDQVAVERLLVADHKSALQEFLQARQVRSAEYRVVREEGPEHQKVFTVELRVDGQSYVTATASTKKAAEQEAARRALVELRQKEHQAS